MSSSKSPIQERESAQRNFRTCSSGSFKAAAMDTVLRAMAPAELKRFAVRFGLADLVDRESLWRLLVVFTARKAAHRIRDEKRRTPGGAAAEL